MERFHDSTVFSLKDTTDNILLSLLANEHAEKDLRLAAGREALSRSLARPDEPADVVLKRRAHVERVVEQLEGVYHAPLYDDPHKVEPPQPTLPQPKIRFVPPAKEYDGLPIESILRGRNILKELVAYFGKPITECSKQDVLRFAAYQGLGQESPVVQAMCLAQLGHDIGGSREDK